MLQVCTLESWILEYSRLLLCKKNSVTDQTMRFNGLNKVCFGCNVLHNNADTAFQKEVCYPEAKRTISRLIVSPEDLCTTHISKGLDISKDSPYFSLTLDPHEMHKIAKGVLYISLYIFYLLQKGDTYIINNKYLGVILDSQLNFGNYINYLYKKY